MLRTLEEQNELDSLNGISDDEILQRFEKAIDIDNEMKRIIGAPICKYDSKRNLAYLEYPDGRREYSEWWTENQKF